MKVLKKGVTHKTWTAKIDCIECKAQLEVNSNDIYRTKDEPWDRFYFPTYFIICPECEEESYVDVPEYVEKVATERR